MLEFSRSLYLCNHLSESIHSWTKGTLPYPLYPTLPHHKPPHCHPHSHPYPTRIHTHAHNQASHSRARLSCDSSYYSYKTSFHSQASVAVSHLSRFHALKKRGAIPCSLYLDQIVKQSGSYKDKPQSFNIQKDKMLDLHVRKVR